jgi:hypothetical protein
VDSWLVLVHPHCPIPEELPGILVKLAGLQGFLQDSSRTEWYQEGPFQWALADKKFLVIPPGILQEQGGECKELLLLIIGQCPTPLDPCILQYIVHGMDIHSLHPAFIGEWHPETRAKVLQWLDIGPAGDITPFQNHLAAYNALEVSLFINLRCLLAILICSAVLGIVAPGAR